ncbi:MAG: M28 family peptidase [Pseudomonadota bacterium]
MIVAVFAVWDARRGADPLDLDLKTLQADVASIAAEPHPLGSEPARRVRSLLEQQLRDLGFEVSVQRTRVDYLHPSRTSASPRVAWVENVVAELPSTTPDEESGTFLLMSHYDSVWQGPGAGDAASGVAAQLAGAREAASQPNRRNRLLVVITDGEEMGLFGAQGFFRQHPLAAEVDLVVNFEARGNAGPPQMFQTSSGNSGLIEMLGDVLGSPLANSISFEVYKRMPNDTDMTISLGEGIPGINFAFIDGYPNYHAATDNSTNLSPRSLAQQAGNAVALTRHLINADLALARTDNDKTYFNLSSWVFVQYSLLTVWLLAGLATAAVLVGLRLVLARRLLSGRSLAVALAALLAVLMNVSNLFESLSDLWFAGGWRDADFWRNFHLYELNFLGAALLTIGGTLWLGRRLSYSVPWVWVGAFLAVQLGIGFFADRLVPVAITVLATLALLYPARRGLPTLAWLALSAMLWTVLGIVALLTLPHASYPAALLALPGGLLLMSARSAEGGDRLNAWLALAWIPALLLMPAMVHAVYLGLGIFLPQLPLALLVLLLAATLLPIAPARSPLSSALLAAGVAVLVTAQFQFRFSATQPRPSELFALTDVATGTSWWGSRDPDPPDFVGAPMAKAEQLPLAELVPNSRGSWWRGAEISGIDAFGPAFTQTTEAGAGAALTLTASETAARAALYFDPPEALAVLHVDGRAVSGTKPTNLRLYGVPAGATIDIERQPGSELTVHWQMAKPGLPNVAPPRPSDNMPTPGTWSDTRIWSGKATF